MIEHNTRGHESRLRNEAETDTGMSRHVLTFFLVLIACERSMMDLLFGVRA